MSVATEIEIHDSRIYIDRTGGLYKEMVKKMKSYGYKIKVLNLEIPYLSMRYNPLHYIWDNDDIPKIADIFVTDIIGHENDGTLENILWHETAKSLLSSIIGYLYEAYPVEQRTLYNVAELLKMTNFRRAFQDPNYKSGLDMLMEDWDKKTSGKSPAVQWYKGYKETGWETADNVLLSCAASFKEFLTPEIENLTCHDELDLENYEKENTVIFIISSQKNTTDFLGNLIGLQLLYIIYKSRRCDNGLVYRTNSGEDSEMDPSVMPLFNQYDLRNSDGKYIIRMRSNKETDRLANAGAIFTTAKDMDFCIKLENYLDVIRIVDPEPYFTLVDFVGDSDDATFYLELHQDRFGNPICYNFPRPGAKEIICQKPFDNTKEIPEKIRI